MNTTNQTIKFFWQHAWKYKNFVIALIFLVPFTILIQNFIPPLIVSNVLDRLSNGDFIAGNLWESFGALLVTYSIIVFLANSIAWRVVLNLLWRLETKVVRDIAQEVFSHLLNLSANFHANHFGGSLTTQTNKLSGAYVRFADTTLFQMANLVISFITTIIILIPQAPLYVGALITFGIIYIIAAIFLTKPLRKLNADAATAVSKQTGSLADGITNVMAVKSFAREDFEKKHFAKATENTRAAELAVMKGSIKKDFYFGSINGIIIASSLVLATASVVIFEQSNIGTVFLILTYTGIITNQLWQFSTSTLRNYNRALGDAKDMIQILDEEPEVKDPSNPKAANIKDGAIEFKKVSFTHGDVKEDDALFNNFNLNIRSGEKIGLVGHSGSGKTTLTKLLLRFNDVDAGSIEIDGQNIATILQKDLRDNIAYVPQEPLLFHRSLRENIAYGKPDATEKEIITAAEKAHALEFIKKLPEGFETLVGERGVKLSGGQRQRIAIARALIKDAPILVLDEATSALDSESEILIQQALQELMQKRTAIVIAHRLSTIQKMDRIVVLDDGKIAEQGTHKELINKKGIYADLWSHQSGGFIEE